MKKIMKIFRKSNNVYFMLPAVVSTSKLHLRAGCKLTECRVQVFIFHCVIIARPRYFYLRMQAARRFKIFYDSKRDARENLRYNEDAGHDGV